MGLNAKDIFLKGLPKDSTLINCKYYKLSENKAVELGESAWYINGEKQFRVSVVENGKSILSETFSQEGTQKNFEKAKSFIDLLKEQEKIIPLYKKQGYILDTELDLLVTVVNRKIIYVELNTLGEMYQCSSQTNIQMFMSETNKSKLDIFKREYADGVYYNGAELCLEYDKKVKSKYSVLIN